MSVSADTAIPFLLAGLAAAVIALLRANAQAAASTRTSQLEQAAALLTVHAWRMERFLEDPGAPPELRRLLVAVSNAMTDRQVVRDITQWLASRPLGWSADSPEADTLTRGLNVLREQEPVLADDFTIAVVTVVTGASLRWPESAALFDRVAMRIAATPRRDLAIAVSATGLRAGGSLASFAPAPLPV